MIELVRWGSTPHGTFGELTMPEFSCYTIERPWLNNRRRESCIPAGEYALEASRFHRGDYDCYELLAVPGRDLIKIHVANTMLDVIGCIGLGKDLGYVASRWAVTESRDTLSAFMVAVAECDAEHIAIRWQEQGGQR